MRRALLHNNNSGLGFNPFAYFPLEQNANDTVGANNGTPTAVTYGAGLYGTGAIFNGSTSKISMPTTLLGTTTGIFSISFLVKANSTDTQYRPFSFNYGVNPIKPYIVIRLNAVGAGSIELYVQSTTGAVTISTASYDITAGVHIGATIIQNDRIRLYVNGNLINTASYGSFTGVATSGSFIGASRSGTLSLNGMMRGFAVWNESIDDIMNDVAQTQLSGNQLI